MRPSNEPSKRLIGALNALDVEQLCIVTGAGISLASGIPTFRGSDENAVWKRDVTELGTYRYFREDPVGSWRWYLERFATLKSAQPNAAHRALVELERWATDRGHGFSLVTQNIDTLHRRAGSQRLIEVHGRGDRVRCARRGCINGAPRGSIPRDAIPIDAFIESPSVETLPRCPNCNDILRQHVLWFDEYYDEHEDYGWQHVLKAAVEADLMIFIGTSFAVGVTELFIQQGVQRAIPMFSIDPGATPPPYAHIEVLAHPAEALLPQVIEQLHHCTRALNQPDTVR